MKEYLLVEAPANRHFEGTIRLPASKSLSNRALVIQALGKHIEITNLSDAQDTQVMTKAIRSVSGGEQVVDIGHAGTAMRFLTAFLAIQSGRFLLTGSPRMQQRPIAPLVSALQQLGAEISYPGKYGYPPLQITGKPITGGSVHIASGLSSQFISALLLIGPALPDGIQIRLDETPASPSYIKMTIGLMTKFGVDCSWEQNVLKVLPGNYSAGCIEIEPDWSSASYFYAAMFLARSGQLTFPGLHQASLQSDAVVAQWFEKLGLHTRFTPEGAIVTKTGHHPEYVSMDFTDNPDLAQTMAMAFAGCGIQGIFKGLETLPHKESDRIKALCEELYKIGYTFTALGNGSRHLRKSAWPTVPGIITFRSHDDHRMAMSCTPLAMELGKIKIEDPSVVNKSFPQFWENCVNAGFRIEERQA